MDAIRLLYLCLHVIQISKNEGTVYVGPNKGDVLIPHLGRTTTKPIRAADDDVSTDKLDISKKYIWWLVKSYLSGCFCLFAPKFWEGGGDL